MYLFQKQYHTYILLDILKFCFIPQIYSSPFICTAPIKIYTLISSKSVEKLQGLPMQFLALVTAELDLNSSVALICEGYM